MRWAEGRRKYSVLNRFGVDPGPAPVVRGFGMVQLGDHHPVQFVHGGPGLVGVGQGVHRVEAENETAAHLAPEHAVEKVHVGVIHALGGLGNQAVTKVVVRRGLFPIPALQQADQVLGLVLPPVGALGVLAGRGVGLVVIGNGLPLVDGHAQVTGQDMVEQGMVGGALDIGLAAQGVHAAAGNAHVAQQQLDHAGRTDVLHPHGVLGPTQGVHHGPGLGGNTRGAVGLVDLEQVFLRHTGDAGDLVQAVARVVLLHQLEHAGRVLQALVFPGQAGLVHLKGPGLGVVLAGLGVETAEQAVLKVQNPCSRGRQRWCIRRRSP